MDIVTALDLLDAMATGAARWDASNAPGSDPEQLVAEHRRVVRDAVRVVASIGLPHLAVPELSPLDAPHQR